MGLERRGNRYYYYQKERQGDRVVSRYLGNSRTAQLIQRLNELDSEQKQLELAEGKRNEDLLSKLASEINQFDSDVEECYRTSLEQAGYRQHHRGEWRKQRGA